MADESCYNVVVSGNEWTITLKPSRPAFLPIPLIRDDVPPDRQKVNIYKPALRGIRYWPPGPYPDENARHEAAQNLIETTHTWTVEEFFRIRESFAGLVHHPSPESFEESLPTLVRVLKTALPNATVDVLRINPQQFAASSVVRLLALIPDIGPAELKSITEAEPRGRGGPYYSFDPKPYFELLSNINYPRTAGFGISLGLEAYVIVDYGIQVNLPPIDSSERRARDIGARVLLAPRSDTIETKVFSRFSHADRHFLRAWLTQRLNHLYAQLTSLQLATQDEKGSLSQCHSSLKYDGPSYQAAA